MFIIQNVPASPANMATQLFNLISYVHTPAMFCREHRITNA